MTDIALRDHLEALIREADRRYEQRFAASEQAVLKAEHTMNERLNSMNEFREALKDQSGKMATRSELERVEEMVQELRRAKANLDGRLVVLSGAVSVAVSVVLWVVSRVIEVL